MRCAKCGYISFDHLDSCPKCHKTMDHGQIKGTTYPVAPPLFFQPVQRDEVDVSEDEIVDVLDPDLDLFADEGTDVVDFDETQAAEQDIVMKADVQAAGDEISPGLDFEKAFAAETHKTDWDPGEKELTIDTSGFEEEALSVQPAQGMRAVSLEIPDELADISDLAPPTAAVLKQDSWATAPSGVASIEDALNLDDLNLDDLGLDELKLSFEDKSNEPLPSSGKQEDKGYLSLDDIDLSGVLETPSPQAQNPSAHDDDLEFDFDLGVREETKGKGEERKKASDDFPDFNLSLD
jgi:hypothetical protein